MPTRDESLTLVFAFQCAAGVLSRFGRRQRSLAPRRPVALWSVPIKQTPPAALPQVTFEEVSHWCTWDHPDSEATGTVCLGANRVMVDCQVTLCSVLRRELTSYLFPQTFRRHFLTWKTCATLPEAVAGNDAHLTRKNTRKHTHATYFWPPAVDLDFTRWHRGLFIGQPFGTVDAK